MQELNWLGIFVISVVSFIGGAIWHGPIFGKLWMKIHHGDKKFTDAENKKLMEGMWKLMIPEFISTVFMVMTLSFLMGTLPLFSWVHLAFLVWIGFILPTMTSVVLWGNDDRKWMLAKISISGSFRLVSLLFSAYILTIW